MTGSSRRFFRQVAMAVVVAGCAEPATSGATGTGSHPDSLKNLPLVEIPSRAPSRVLALVMSGDGNWAHFVRELADTLADRGVPVVGLQSRSYLSRPRTPGELARDMEPVLHHYLRAWSAEEILVAGYSRGADFAPFLVNRISPELRASIRAVALLSPTEMASFEFHLLDLVRYRHRDTDLDAVPEVEALAPIPVLCIYGRDDESALCPHLPEGLAEVVPLDAGHRLRDPGRVADLILHRLEENPIAGAPPTRPTSSGFPSGSRR